MNILIGCEESQAVCLAFRKLGFNAYSNDLKPCSGGFPEFHLQMDVYDAINSRKWDMIGLHPVCTKMALSGNRTYGVGKLKHIERLDAVAWTVQLFEYAVSVCPNVYMENPMGAMNSDKRLPTPQIIQPYYFGDEFQKTTCLWLKGLPLLFHCKTSGFLFKKTHVSRGDMITFESGNTMPKWYADAWKLPEYERKELRSKTFPGIAKAMAEQWGYFLKNNKRKPIYD